MKIFFIALSLVIFFLSPNVLASIDTFGDGETQFSIEFVDISGDNGDLGSWVAGTDYTFSGVTKANYRIGKFEITNEQWNKFAENLGVPITGNPLGAYGTFVNFRDSGVATTRLSWYEAAQFVNYLNTSKGYYPAYKFTGTQGTTNYSFDVWEQDDTGFDASNPFRNSNAHYFLPTEDEWVKAAYWNGTNLQTYAMTDNSLPIEDIESNYGFETGAQPWATGIGKQELNGTFDIMGNVWEWMENPYINGNYLANSDRSVRGGSWGTSLEYLSSSIRDNMTPTVESDVTGFRVASIPEPTSLAILALGGLLLRKRKYKN